MVIPINYNTTIMILNSNKYLATLKGLCPTDENKGIFPKTKDHMYSSEITQITLYGTRLCDGSKLRSYGTVLV